MKWKASRGVSAARGQVVLARAAATPEAYRAAGPGGFSAIHFTAHAVANRESPLDSAVLLSGGKLYAREVMDVPLTADLVTVSACRGVGVRTYSGEGLVGFAWAFLRAGARHVIAGLWDVNDQSTAALMDVLYRELAAGKPPAARPARRQAVAHRIAGQSAQSPTTGPPSSSTPSRRNGSRPHRFTWSVGLDRLIHNDRLSRGIQ